MGGHGCQLCNKCHLWIINIFSWGFNILIRASDLGTSADAAPADDDYNNELLL